MKLVWFRSDLRVADNPALLTACQSSDEVVGLFVATPTQWQQHHWGDNKVSFVAAHVTALRQQLAALNIPLHSMEVDTFDQLPAQLTDFCRQLNVSEVLCNDEPGVHEQQRDLRVCQHLLDNGIAWQRFAERNLLQYDEILNGSGEPYRVFTPFMKRARQWLAEHPQQPLEIPQKQARVLSKSIDSWYNQPAYTLKWPIGEQAAQQSAEEFCSAAIDKYHQQRDFPAINGTSSISPYLAAGVISAIQVQSLLLRYSSASDGQYTWFNELLWREFYRYLMHHFPHLSKSRAMYPKKEPDWQNDPQQFERWKAGTTGYPMVDAGMRQLRTTGWMHNRLRMLCANFLVRDLHIDWRWGEAYFAQSLVDYDFPSNNGGWQWAAGCGADAAPYFRHFSPARQAERFDPNQHYQRAHLPELSDGTQSYPEPMVDHRHQTARFTALVKALRHDP